MSKQSVVCKWVIRCNYEVTDVIAVTCRYAKMTSAAGKLNYGPILWCHGYCRIFSLVGYDGEPTTSRKIQGKGDAQMPPFFYISKDGCGSRVWTCPISIDISLTYFPVFSYDIRTVKPDQKRGMEENTKTPIVIGDSIILRIWLSPTILPPFLPRWEGKRSRGAVSSHIGRSAHYHRVRQMRNPCNIQSKRARSELLDTVLEGPDQLDQVLSAHLAPSRSCFPAVRAWIITSYPIFFFFFFAAKSLLRLRH